MMEIEIGGKKRKFSFGIRALGNVLKEFDNDIHGYLDLLQSNGFLTVGPTLYHLHAHAAKREGKEVDFTVDDVEDWVEQLDGKFHNKDVQNVLAEFIGTLASYLPEQEENKDDPKKK